MQNPIKVWRKKQKEAYEARVVFRSHNGFDYDKNGQTLNFFTGFSFWLSIATIITGTLAFVSWSYLAWLVSQY